MIGRFIRDESGIAMGLAVIVVLLVGVMGAGLLVFVRNDLQTVVEVNQGQKAFNAADAGQAAAKQQILGDKIPAHYDVDDSSDPNYLDASCNVDNADSSESIDRTPAGENWSPEAGGQTRNFAGGKFTVTIRWLNPDTSAPAECIAPETGALPDGVDYFKVTSTGYYPDDESGAKRKVEAIYNTYDLHVPQAYYTPGDIIVSGTACIDSVSLFTLSDVTFNGSGQCPDTGTHMQDTDIAYGDWNDPPSDEFNTTPRATDLAGVGVVGQVTGSDDMGIRDYDGADADSDGAEFVQTPSDPQTSDEITFPFNLANQPDADRLCDEAKAQGNYEEYTTSGNKSLDSWPTDSSQNTVVCKVFNDVDSSNKLIWDIDGDGTAPAEPYDDCEGPVQEGTLVIKGGNFKTKSNKALFRGVVVVRGAEGSDTTDLGSSTDTGNTCLDGFVNATSEIKIAGTVKPSTSLETSDRPGFYGVRQWSWRELYE